MSRVRHPVFFFFNDTATTEIYTLSLHDAHPISWQCPSRPRGPSLWGGCNRKGSAAPPRAPSSGRDRKSTRLNSSHSQKSYAVFCFKKKNNTTTIAVPSTLAKAYVHTRAEHDGPR